MAFKAVWNDSIKKNQNWTKKPLNKAKSEALNSLICNWHAIVKDVRTQIAMLYISPTG